MRYPELEPFVEAAQEAIRQAPDGNLPFGFRLTLRKLLEKLFPGENRYALLCYLSAKELVPGWRALRLERYYDELPDRLLDLCRIAIMQPGDRDARVGRMHDLGSAVDDAIAMSGHTLGHWSRARFVPFAAYAAVSAALNSPSIEVFDETDTEWDIEPDLLDTHAYVAMDYAGCLWNSNSNPQARREYWLRWLSEEVPRVFASSPEELLRASG